MSDQEQTDTKVTDLASKPIDYVASFGKAALGSVPIAGPFLSELVGTVIPQQRVDRLVKFAEELHKRLGDIEQSTLYSKLRDEDATELLEEAMRQAARSTSDERRKYLASVVANSITKDQVSAISARHLLRILGEIDDAEVIVLASYRGRRRDRTGFYEKHKDVLGPVKAFLGSDQDTVDKATIQTSYKNHLVDLYLLTPQYKRDAKTKQPIFDSMSGAQIVEQHKLSALGGLLLRQIDVVGTDGEEDEE